MALSEIQNLKSDVQYLLRHALNSVDLCELFILIDRFDEDNQRWMLNFIHGIFSTKKEFKMWHIFEREPDEYISISQEILDILEGNICTYEITDPDSDEKIAWKVYPLRE